MPIAEANIPVKIDELKERIANRDVLKGQNKRCMTGLEKYRNRETNYKTQ